jgi:hypothetical protein
MEHRENEIDGTVQGGVIYASPDFPDAGFSDMKPNTSVRQVVSNLTLYHISDTAEKQQQFRQWRKKVREIIQNHEEKILQFFIKELPDDQSLKAAHNLLIKYGKASTHDIFKQTPQFFKQFIQEAPQKGNDLLNSYIEELMKSKINDPPIQRWVSMSKQLLDYMRETGDELIRIDQKLQSECSRIDLVTEKVLQLVALPNPEIPGFQEMMDLYIEKQFETSDLENFYWDYIFTLQKYSALRDILIPARAITQSDPICCVCLVNSVNIAFTPCGHTFCSDCSRRTSSCHICRQVISSRLKLFFG